MDSWIEAFLITQQKKKKITEIMRNAEINPLDIVFSSRSVVVCVHLKFSVCSCRCGLFDQCAAVYVWPLRMHTPV